MSVDRGLHTSEFILPVEDTTAVSKFGIEVVHPREMRRHKDLYANIHKNIIPNSSKLDTLLESTNGQTAKQNAAYLDNGILARKRMIHHIAWMNLQTVMLSKEVRCKRANCIIPFI